jgi:hypothetical protein
LKLKKVRREREKKEEVKRGKMLRCKDGPKR